MLVNDLKKIPLFEHFRRQALIQLAGFVKVENYDAQRIIFHEGKIRDKLYIVLSGSIVIEKKILGQQEPLAVFKTYEVVGETIVYSPGGKHNHSGKSLEAGTTVLEVSIYSLAKIFRQHPETVSLVQQYFIKTLSERLSRTNNKLLTLFAISKLADTFRDRTSLIDALLADLVKLFRVKHALIISFEPLMKKIRLEGSLGFNGKGLPAIWSLHNDTLASLVFSTKKYLLVTPKTWEKKFATAPYGSKNMLLCPIRHRKEITGCIILTDKINSHHFSLNNEILLSAISQQIGPVLEQLSQEQAEQNQRSFKKVYIDPFNT